MSSNLETVLNKIQTNKNTNVKPENIRYGVDILGVNGTMRPVEVTGGDTGTCVYTQNETPTDFNGIWINTDKNCNDIYVEDSYCPTVEQPIFQGFDEGDENVVYNTVPPYDIAGATTCQIGNVIHFFGQEVYNPDNAPTTAHSNHYKYDFETNTWTKLADCPTPQGFGGAVNIGNYIYIIGCGFADYFNYVYKYNIEDDSWEKVGEMAGSDFTLVKTTADDPIKFWACKDSSDNIYISFSLRVCTSTYNSRVNYIGIFKLNINTATITVLVQNNNVYNRSTAFSIESLVCSNDIVAFNFYGYNSSTYYQLLLHDIATGSNTKISLNNDPISCRKKINFNGYVYSTYYNKLYIDSITKNAITSVQSFNISNNHDIDQRYFMSSNGSTIYTKSQQFIVTKDNVDYLLMFGPASYTTTRTMAIRLTDKTYDLDNDTVMIYTDKNAGGLYKTQMFNSTRVIGTGKLYSYFSNVNLYDTTQQKIIKNLTTYYGNGTEWVKLK